MRIRCVFWLSISTLALAQPKKLTLSDAENLALRNHPRAASAALIAEAARMGVVEAKAPFSPQVSGAFTGVAAEHGSTLSAGTIQTSSLYSRIAAGVTVSQLVTDFGRTGNLVASARARAAAQDQNAANVRVLEFAQPYHRIRTRRLPRRQQIRWAQQTADVIGAKG